MQNTLSFLPYAYNVGMNDHVRPVVIGIAGGTGSGKTTVAQVILERVGADSIAFLAHDAYYVLSISITLILSRPNFS